MSVTRTPLIDVDKEFTVDVPVTKAYVGQDGRRHIVGVCTGLREDRDGERVSKNAIVGMGRKIQSGAVKVTSSHQQDWMTEIGDVEKYAYDADTDEMEVDGVLPPEGIDPIADKAWREANKPNSRLGWSIGGKLLKSYFERNEVGKKRKVLDAIDLRHVMLTKNPAYPGSFAHGVVAKTFEGDAPADDAFTVDGAADDLVTKDTTGSWVSGGSDSGGGNSGRDSVGSGQRNAGSRKPGQKGMRTDDDGSNDDGQEDEDRDLPKAPDERHLACPNCGHEFAADLPVDADEQQPDDDDESEDDRDTGKSTPQLGDVMKTLAETLESVKALAAAQSAPVEKTDEAAETDATTDVEKAATDGDDVMKAIAAVFQHGENQLGELRGQISEAFELVAKSHQKIVSMIEDLPQGRKSVATIRQPTVGHDDTVGKAETVDEEVAKTDTLVDALKVLNKRTYGVE